MKYPPLKYYLIEKGITQKELRERTHLSIGTVNRLVNEGKASNSIIRYLALDLNFTEADFREKMLAIPREPKVGKKSKKKK